MFYSYAFLCTSGFATTNVVFFWGGCVTLFKVLPHKLVYVRVCLSLSYSLFPL